MKFHEVENQLALALTRLEDLVLEDARVSDGLGLEPISPFKFFVCWDRLAAKPTAKWVGDITEGEDRLCELNPDHVKHGTPRAARYKYMVAVLTYMLDHGIKVDWDSQRVGTRSQKILFVDEPSTKETSNG